MPKAVGISKGKKDNLDSVPGGFVSLRRFTYGEILFRQNLSGEISGTPGADDSKMERINIKVDNVTLQHFELSHAVVEHNLTDEDDKPLDFKKPEDIDKLDGVVGQEIAKLIDDLNKAPDKDSSKSV